MVSYEVSIGLVVITVCICVGSLNLTEMVLAQQKDWFCIPSFPVLQEAEKKALGKWSSFLLKDKR